MHGNYICHHLNKYAYGVLLMTDTTMADIFPNTKLNSYQLELDQSDTWKGFDKGKFTVATNPIPSNIYALTKHRSM